MGKNHTNSIYQHLGIFILAFFFVCGLLYCYATPLWSPPDEDRHFAYCEYIALNKRFPNLNAQDKTFHISQAVHPPLYYLIGSLFCKKDREPLFKQLSINEGPGYTIVQPKAEVDNSYSGIIKTAYILRILSLCFSTLTIYLAYKIILSIFPGNYIMAATGVLFIASNPQFLHVSTSISNEPLSTTFSALYVFILINFLKPLFKPYAYVIAGIVLGCCLLTKLSTIIYIPITVLAIAFAYGRAAVKIFWGLFIILFTALLVSGWWYLRNWILFNDPMFLKAIEAIQPWSIRKTPFSMSYGVLIIKMTFTSFFGYFGSMQIPIMQSHIMFYALVVASSAIGLFRIMATRTADLTQTRIIILMLTSIGCCILLFIKFNIHYGMFMGRYLFVVLVPIAIVTAAGLQGLTSDRRSNYVLLVISFLLIAVNLDVFFRVLKPAYAATLLSAGINVDSFCCTTPEINSATSVSQIFTSPQDKLCAIRVMFSSKDKLQDGEIQFTLKEYGDNTMILSEITVPLKQIDDFAKYFFMFPPIHNSKGKQYVFSLKTVFYNQGTGTSLWYDKEISRDSCPMLINGRQSKGALYFSTYHFTGNQPKTDWQGRRQIAINQGWYISLRELQFYGELPEDYRMQTTTYKKMLQFKNAYNNRNQYNSTIHPGSS